MKNIAVEVWHVAIDYQFCLACHRKKISWRLWWTGMRPERKQKAKDGELEMPSNQRVLGLLPCFSATATPSSICLFCPFLAAPWNNLTHLLNSESDLCSVEEGRLTPLARSSTVGCPMPWKGKGLVLYDTPWFAVVLGFARVYKWIRRQKMEVPT